MREEEYLKQTDFRKENPQIAKAGCLFITLLTIAQKAAGKRLSKQDVLFMYEHLIKRGHMEDDCYVNDHAAVINEGLVFLKDFNKKAFYVGAFYVDEALAARKPAWGSRKGDYIAAHVRTIRGNGHFRLFTYDPFAPSPKYDRILSLRYYEVKEV